LYLKDYFKIIKFPIIFHKNWKELFFNIKYAYEYFVYSKKRSQKSKFYYIKKNKYNYFWYKTAQVHINFVLNYFEVKNYLRAPFIAKTCSPIIFNNINNINKDNFYTSRKIKNISRKLNKIFSYIKVDTFKHYLSNYNYFFSKKIIGNRNFKLIKNLDAVEIGPGLGFNSLLYSLYNKKLIFFYDLDYMIHLQQNIYNLLKKYFTIKKIYFATEPEKLKNNIKNRYFVVGFNSLNEMPLTKRKLLEPLIKDSVFSLFTFNTSFEGVNNYKYFKKLSKKIKRKIIFKDYKFPNQRNFTNKHKYCIIQ